VAEVTRDLDPGSIASPVQSHDGPGRRQEVDDGALSAERWFGGPATNRRAYAVDDVTALVDTDNAVVRAERIPAADEPDAYAGPVSLKLHTDASSIDRPQLAARLDAVAAVRHPNLGRPIESFTGPGLARRPEDADTADDVFYVAARCAV
jgi:hypothetical protein